MQGANSQTVAHDSTKLASIGSGCVICGLFSTQCHRFCKLSLLWTTSTKCSKVIRKSTVMRVRPANKANEPELLILVRWQNRYGLAACWQAVGGAFYP
jgi:hypothetical protein